MSTNTLITEQASQRGGSVRSQPNKNRPSPSSQRLAARAIGATKLYETKSSQVRALDNISVDFPRGRFTAVMGPSGSGKSTLMHCLAGLDNVSSGKIMIGDAEVSNMNQNELTLLRRQHIGFVFQAFNLVPTLTARENIVLPLDMAGAKPNEEWFNQVIEAVDIADRLDHKPDELSGGQQQRVAVSRAMAGQPEIIFADEPTGNLDSITGNEILSFMRKAVDDFEQTIVMVTHDAVAASYSDHVLFLADGKIVDDLSEPTADRVLDRIRSLRRK